MSLGNPPTPLDDYYQERISELDEEIYRLRDELNHLRMDLTDSEAFNEQLSRELADLRSRESKEASETTENTSRHQA